METLLQFNGLRKILLNRLKLCNVNNFVVSLCIFNWHCDFYCLIENFTLDVKHNKQFSNNCKNNELHVFLNINCIRCVAAIRTFCPTTENSVYYYTKSNVKDIHHFPDLSYTRASYCLQKR